MRRTYSNDWGWRIGKFGVIEILFRRLNTKEVLLTPKRWRICISCGRWFSKIIRKKLRIPRTNSETGIHREERESQRRISWRLGRVSTWRNKRWVRNQWGILGSRRSSERRIVIILNWEIQLHVPRKEWYPIPLSNIDFVRSTDADRETTQEKRNYDCWYVDENRNLSESWTGYHKVYVIERNSSKGYEQSGRETVENSEDITCRSHMAWRIDKNWVSNSKKKESRISESRNCYSMRKTVFPNMHTGNRCSKKRRAEVSEDKTHFYGYCRGKTEFCVVLQLDTRLRSDEKIWKKVLHLSFLLLRWKLALAVSSRGTAYLWDKILRVTIDPGEYETLTSVNLGRKKFELRKLICSSNLWCTHECGV